MYLQCLFTDADSLFHTPKLLAQTHPAESHQNKATPEGCNLQKTPQQLRREAVCHNWNKTDQQMTIQNSLAHPLLHVQPAAAAMAFTG